MAVSTSDRKIIVSKDRVEFYSFNNFYNYGKTDVPRPLKNEKKSTPSELYMTDEQILEQKRRYTLANRIRSQQNLVRLVNANKIYDRGRHSFLTLTYKDDVRDIAKAQRDFAKFIQRFNYYLLNVKNTQPLRYVAVIEFQDKNRGGVIHFHVILFNVPYLRAEKVVSLWSHGRIDIRARDKNGNPLTVTRVSAYMAKYMAKAFNDSRLHAKKKYFCSRSLERPVVVREPAYVDSLHYYIPSSHAVYRKNYHSKYMGDSVYIVYENVPLELVEMILSQAPPVPRYANNNW